MTQPEPTGAQLRDVGVADVLAADQAVHRDLAREIARVIDQFAATGEPFSADNVRDALPPDVIERAAPNVLPGVFRARCHSGVIEQVGYTTSNRPARHHGVLRTWRGTSPDGPEARHA